MDCLCLPRPHTLPAALFVSLLLAPALSGCATQPPPRPSGLESADEQVLLDYFDSWVAAETQRRGITGLAVAVVDEQDVLWTQGFGYADRNEKRPVTPDTFFNIGSVSKLITAKAVMRLVEEGRVDLDAPLQTYLPEFSIQSRFPEENTVTLRGLVTHRAGLPSDYFKDWTTGEHAPTDEPRFTELAGMLSDDYLSSQPGTVFSYSNLGFSLVGAVVERVSGMPFEDYVATHLLRPMDMTHSSFIRTEAVEERLATGYLGRKAAPLPYLRDLPAGSMNSSATEMAQLLRMILAGGMSPGGRVLEAESIEQMFVPQNEAHERDGGFRLGLTYWNMDPLPGHVRGFGHIGDLPPFCAVLIVVPEHKLGAVLLANSQVGSLSLMEMAMHLLRAAVENKTGQPLPVAPKVPVASEQFTDISALPGIYGTSFGLVEVRPRGDTLRVRMRGVNLHAVPYADKTFGVQFRLLNLFTVPIGELETIKLSFQALPDGTQTSSSRSKGCSWEWAIRSRRSHSHPRGRNDSAGTRR